MDLSYHPDIQPVCQQIPLRTTTNDERSHSGVRGGGWIGHPSSGKPKFSRSPVRTRRSIGKGYEKEKSTTEEAKIQDTEFADSFISKFGHYFQLNEPLSLGR